MEEKQLEQINNLSKDELVERINRHFDTQATSSLVIAILWGIIAIFSILFDLYASVYRILLACLWLLLFLMGFFQFLEYRKMSKEDSAEGLLNRNDK